MTLVTLVEFKQHIPKSKKRHTRYGVAPRIMCSLSHLCRCVYSCISSLRPIRCHLGSMNTPNIEPSLMPLRRTRPCPCSFSISTIVEPIAMLCPVRTTIASMPLYRSFSLTSNYLHLPKFIDKFHLTGSASSRFAPLMRGSYGTSRQEKYTHACTEFCKRL